MIALFGPGHRFPGRGDGTAQRITPSARGGWPRFRRDTFRAARTTGARDHSERGVQGQEHLEIFTRVMDLHQGIPQSHQRSPQSRWKARPALHPQGAPLSDSYENAVGECPTLGCGLLQPISTAPR